MKDQEKVKVNHSKFGDIELYFDHEEVRTEANLDFIFKIIMTEGKAEKYLSLLSKALKDLNRQENEVKKLLANKKRLARECIIARKNETIKKRITG